MTEIKEQAISTQWKDVKKTSWVKLILIVALFCALFWHNIVDMVIVWTRDDNWSHGFIIPLFSLYLINKRKSLILGEPFVPSLAGLIAMIGLICMYIFNIVQLRYAYGEPLLMLATMFAVVLFMCGWRLMKHLWLPIAFLFFAIPIPTRVYRGITIPLRHISAQFATAFINLLPNLDATARGVIIDVSYKGKPLDTALDVAEACSGMRLLMAFLALGVAMAYLHDRALWQRITLLACTIPIAIICNIVRVCITAMIHIFIGAQYATGIYHDTLGLLMLPLAFVLYWSIDWFMEQLFITEQPEQKSAKPEQKVIRRKKTAGKVVGK